MYDVIWYTVCQWACRDDVEQVPKGNPVLSLKGTSHEDANIRVVKTPCSKKGCDTITQTPYPG